MAASISSGAAAAVPVGEWQAIWFVDEKFDTTGEIGAGPYPTETFTLFIEDFDAATNSYGSLVFDNVGFPVTQGLIRNLQFDGTNLTAGIDYTPFLPQWPAGSAFFTQLDAVVSGNTMTGLFDEVAPSPLTNFITFRGDFSAVNVPEPSTALLVAAGCAGLVVRRRWGSSL